jgi:hypothetical protein
MTSATTAGRRRRVLRVDNPKERWGKVCKAHRLRKRADTPQLPRKTHQQGNAQALVKEGVLVNTAVAVSIPMAKNKRKGYRNTHLCLVQEREGARVT